MSQGIRTLALLDGKVSLLKDINQSKIPLKTIKYQKHLVTTKKKNADADNSRMIPTKSV